MREIAILTFVTLDGVMQAPKLPEEDRSGGFSRGGWAAPFWDEVMAHVRSTAMAEPYDLLLGRKTYDQFAAHFSADSEAPMNLACKYVVTSTGGLTWNNSAALSNAHEEVQRVKQGEGGLLQIHGSWQLVQSLLAHDLIDIFRIWTFPVLIGSGKRLFQSEQMPGPLELVRSEKAGDSGVVLNEYRRLRDAD